MTDFDKILNDPVSRRAFLTRMTAVGLGAAAVALLAPEAAQASGKQVLELINIPDDGSIPGIKGRNKTEQVLNYALTLETLEADLYRQALNLAAGKSLDTPLPTDVSSYTLSVAPGPVTSRNAALGFLYLQEFAAVEAAHRDFLRAAISGMGGTPVEANPGGYKADFGDTLYSILAVIRTVEETGVRAYLGAAQFINDFNVTQTAASIYSTECRHSAAINYVLGVDAGPSRMRSDQQAVFNEGATNNFEHWLTPTQVITMVKPFFA
jgi:hypothetical protein